MLQDLLIEVAVYFGLALPFVLLEAWRPARELRVRSVLARDLFAYVLVLGSGILIGLALDAAIERYSLPDFFASRGPHLPLWAVFVVALVASDWLIYWVHRVLHTRAGWPSHRWHHAPRHMYWLAGIRASFVHNALYTVPIVVPIALNAPPIIYLLAVGVRHLTNHWMHTNWTFRNRALEWILITPRAHHVHHSRDPRHYGHNLGSIFSVWDRLHGTWLDPDSIDEPIAFGIPEEVHPARLVVGL